MSIKYQIISLIAAENVATDITSDILDLRFNLGCYVQATFTGSPTGSVVLQASNDQITWTTLDTVTISGTTPLSINKTDIYAPYLRIFKAGGGTGSMTVTLTIKGV